ncbi:MAG TPA: ABC transporter ATP-binding protein [Verrucomicrobiae bacterium]|jgi:ABC-2 type transport system ATP-binding protein|nr:ABC transporter ATP-binding protein [Verrucomicrobiae bacterium]
MKLTQENPEAGKTHMEQSAVSVRDLRHAYRSREALKGVSFEVRKGEIFGMLGPNGSGKTTLFRILSTLFPPSSGDAVVLGHSLAKDYAAVRQKIGVVFQAPSLDAKLTVRENLVHQALLYGFCGAELKRRCDKMLDQVGLRDRASEAVFRLSGGMKRRVELAKGLLHDPEIVLLDEPSTGLDPGARIDLWQYLRRLRDAGVTVLVTTHLMEEAEHCDRIAILNLGQIIRLGTPQALRQEIGGDVLVVRGPDLAALADQIRARFSVTCRVMDQELLIEHEQGARFVTSLVEAFPGRLESVTFRKPTLEDVFVHSTGHRFWNEVPEKETHGKK